MVTAAESERKRGEGGKCEYGGAEGRRTRGQERRQERPVRFQGD